MKFCNKILGFIILGACISSPLTSLQGMQIENLHDHHVDFLSMPTKNSEFLVTSYRLPNREELKQRFSDKVFRVLINRTDFLDDFAEQEIDVAGILFTLHLHIAQIPQESIQLAIMRVYYEHMIAQLATLLLLEHPTAQYDIEYQITGHNQSLTTLPYNKQDWHLSFKQFYASLQPCKDL